MNLTSTFAGAARGYPIGTGQVEVRASGSGMRKRPRDDEWHRLKLNGLATLAGTLVGDGAVAEHVVATGDGVFRKATYCCEHSGRCQWVNSVGLPEGSW
jgi:hypothetical protein